VLDVLGLRVPQELVLLGLRVGLLGCSNEKLSLLSLCNTALLGWSVDLAIGMAVFGRCAKHIALLAMLCLELAVLEVDILDCRPLSAYLSLSNGSRKPVGDS
jgi:hypothetical protein